MTNLELPKQLEGRWNNAVFLTYGVNLPFFERAIWRILDSSCTNVIIIGDGERIIDSYKGYSETLNVRWVNQKYIVDGVFGATFHTKFILLTSSQKGRLLVGSGNLGIQGYASGGEMFVQYEYDPSSEITDHLPVFVTAKRYLNRLIEEGNILPQTERQLQILFEETSWLYHGNDNDSVLKSNLDTPFIDHFLSAIDGESVNELKVLSPFYDEKAIALQKLVEGLNPHKVNVYLQDGETSIDPQALESISIRFPGKIHTHLVSIQDGGIFIHNKLFIANTPSKTVCLQGSPNMTQRAFLLCPPRGNYEIANLLIGEPNKFDYLFESLTISQQVTDYTKLDCEYIGGEDGEKTEEDNLLNCWLIGGEWQKDYLTIFYRGEIPELSMATLLAGDSEFALKLKNSTAKSIEIETNNILTNLLDRNLPIQIVWPDARRTNPIFPCNLAELSKTIEFDDSDHLSRIGDFELGDKELESLLHELDSSLIIDKQSVNSIWQTAGRGELDREFDDGLRIDYSEVDYDMLRSHPKLAQYREWRPGGKTYRKTKLQIILSSITSHFQGLINTTVDVNFPITTDLATEELEEDFAQENAQEVEEQEIEREKRRVRGQARMGRILKAFIRRYLKGITSVEFLKLVEYDVIANNYIIFSHVLWRLYGLDWVEDDFVTDSYIKMFQFMWGQKGKRGYFQLLDQEGKSFCSEIFKEGKAIARMIAAIYYADYLSTLQGWIETRFELRDFWRHYLDVLPYVISTDSLEDAWYLVGHMLVYNPPFPSKIVERLNILAEWETSQSFLRSIEKEIGLSENSVQFSVNPVGVMRPAIRKQVQIRQLEFRDELGIDTREKAEKACLLWMGYEDMDFYRIVSLNNNILYLYDKEFKEGLYYNKNVDIDEEFTELMQLELSSRDAKLNNLVDIGRQVDELIQMMETSSVNENNFQ